MVSLFSLVGYVDAGFRQFSLVGYVDAGFRQFSLVGYVDAGFRHSLGQTKDYTE